MAERLMDAAGRLDLYPQRGRPISAERREIVVVTPYLIRYRIDRDEVTVLEVRHSARSPG
jgi:plasmid stabilization system protein ParE